MSENSTKFHYTISHISFLISYISNIKEYRSRYKIKFYHKNNKDNLKSLHSITQRDEIIDYYQTIFYYLIKS